MLMSLIKGWTSRRPGNARISVLRDAKLDANPAEKWVLNVGGGSKQIAIPDHYAQWRHLLLDINPTPDADIVCDARELEMRLDCDQFDAIYCSHNLEHYFEHDVGRVLGGFLHVLKPGGFAEIRVPDLTAVFRHIVKHEIDIATELYRTKSHSFRALDVIYGWALQISESGNDFYSHKTGFSTASLISTLRSAGFREVQVGVPMETFEIRVVAFKGSPTAEQRAALGL